MTDKTSISINNFEWFDTGAKSELDLFMINNSIKEFHDSIDFNKCNLEDEVIKKHIVSNNNLTHSHSIELIKDTICKNNFILRYTVKKDNRDFYSISIYLDSKGNAI